MGDSCGSSRNLGSGKKRERHVRKTTGAGHAHTEKVGEYGVQNARKVKSPGAKCRWIETGQMKLKELEGQT